MKSRAVDSVAAEIAKEKAEAFGRTTAALQGALDELRRFDAAPATTADAAARAALVASAAERLLHVIVHREACGLRDARYIFDFYGVPHEVVRRMGARSA
jgi:hypothetical protein